MLLAFDLNIAQTCNLSCSYCYEPKITQNFLLPFQYNKILEFIWGLYRQRWFSASGNYYGILLRFWGGEPTLNTEIIEKFYNSLHRTQSIHFNIFTNGVWNKKFKDFISKEPTRLSLQISYDGQPLQNKRRQADILDNIILASNLVPVTLKSTIMLEDIEYMYDCYCDVKRIIQKLNLNTNYEPTLDVFSKYILNKELLNEQLNKIYKADSTGARRYFVWKSGKCMPGVRHFGIDMDGNIFPCHGWFYFKDKIEPITSINSPTCYKDLQLSISELKYISDDMIYGIINCPLATRLKNESRE